MSENLRNFVRAAYALDAVVHRVPAISWSQQSPCEDWSAAEVLGHVVWGFRRLANDAVGRPPPLPQPEADIVGDDPLRVWDATFTELLVALDQADVLDRPAETPFGTTTVDGVLGFLPSDVMAHTWDIATTAGLEAHLPLDLCERFEAGLAAIGDRLRGPGMMAEAVKVAADSDPESRFIAQTGRTP